MLYNPRDRLQNVFVLSEHSIYTKQMPTWILEALFVLTWSSGFIGVEYALPFAGAFTFLFVRYLLLSVGLTLYLKLKGSGAWLGLGTRRAFFQGALVGVFAHAVWLSAVYYAQALGVSPGLSALITALQPLVVGALAGVSLAEKSSAWQWLGLTLGFVGVLVAVSGEVSLRPSTPLLAYGLPFISALSAAFAVLYQRSLEREWDVPLLPSLTVQCLASTVVLFPAALFFEGIKLELTPTFFFALAWLCLVATLAAYGLLWTLLKRVSSTRASSLMYLTPPATMVIAFLLLGERLTWNGLAGLGLTGIAVLLVRQRRRLG